ncbi:hypothetical protein J437_LFUL018736 [Ladona fulva]|uniref:Nucleic-acid-binding protein from transposon X-element n=1 Tax=Ladona fulva TaxID=123851 RepID=A0A8K0PB76_LADFU|nr:hypothetical protein J437_LFUL018736 [Ladona fulva]
MLSKNPGPFPKRPCPLFRVVTSNDTNKEEYHNISLRVRVSDFTKPKTPVQCINCQQLGHTKNYCNFKANCVKCGGPHHTSDCKKEPTDQPQCYLCKEHHTANYRGCRVYLRAKEAIKNRNKPKTPNLTSNNHFPTLPTKPQQYNNPSPSTWPTSAQPTTNSPADEEEDLQTWFFAILSRMVVVRSYLPLLC